MASDRDPERSSVRMDELVSLCARRGFIFQSGELYGGINGFWDYGPLGVELKNNLRDFWWESMVRNPPPGPDGEEFQIVGLDCSIISHPRVWEASGHVGGFNDPMQTCRQCKKLFRADHVWEGLQESEWVKALRTEFPGVTQDFLRPRFPDVTRWFESRGKKLAKGLAIVRNQAAVKPPDVVNELTAAQSRVKAANVELEKALKALAEAKKQSHFDERKTNIERDPKRKNQPMYVPAGALVTNLSVHLEWANENALVWVTTLDHAQPVAGARIAVQDCNGSVIGSGQTDDDGLLRLTGLPDEEHAPRCYKSERFEGFDGLDYRDYYAAKALNELDGGLFVTAQTDNDLSFVHSSWQDGIEPWRFQLPSEDWQAPIAAHTIFDRTLFRAGDTVHMKHVLRRETMSGFGTVAAAQQPTTAIIRHLGSDETYELPLTWDAAGFAEQSWPIPAAAKLGQYDVSLKNGDQQWTSGSFRLEQFRVPLMQATVQVPADPQVGVSNLPVDIAIRYLAGGAAADLPVVLRAQIRDRAAPHPDAFERVTFANGPVKEGVVRESDAREREPAGAQKPGVHQRQELKLDSAGTARGEISNLPAVSTVRELLTEVESHVKSAYLTGWLAWVDRIVHRFRRIDDVVAMWDVDRARDAAWTNAQALWALGGEPPLAGDYLLALDRMVGLASRGLLVPADSWLLELGRRLDLGGRWL
jgi:hypothetical protein